MHSEQDLNENLKSSQPLVIGVGLPRTGTMSTALALANLLNCEMSQIQHGMLLKKLRQDQLDFWIKALDGHVTDQEWRNYFEEYKACLDLPVIMFYKDILRAFPQVSEVDGDLLMNFQ